jgi:hypothetical protein
VKPRNWTECNIEILQVNRNCVHCRILMDYKDLQEIKHVLRIHEKSIQENRSSILTSTTKMHKNEYQVTT